MLQNFAASKVSAKVCCVKYRGLEIIMNFGKKFISIVVCMGLLMSNAVIPGYAKYTTEIPDALMCEIYNYTTSGGTFGGGKSKWTVYDATTSSTSDTKIENLPNAYVNSIIGSVPTTSVEGGSGLYVGRFQNSQGITQYSVNSNGDYSSTGGAAKFMLDNTDIEDGQDYIALIGNFKANYYSNRSGISWDGKGANSKIEVINTDISAYSKNAYVVVGLKAEENTDLDSTYISIASWYIKNAEGVSLSNNKFSGVTGVPISRYYTESDKGTYREIAIPLSDFDTSNDWVQGKLALNGVDRPDGFPDSYKVPVNLKGFMGMGIMKLRTDYTPEGNDALFVTKFQIASFNTPVEGLKLERGDGNGALSWSKPLNNSVSHYQIACVNGNDTKNFYVPVGELEQRSGMYFWNIPDGVESGSLFKVSAVAGELAGNEDVGYYPIYSDYSQCKSGTGLTAVEESLDVSLAGKGMNSENLNLPDGTNMRGVSYGKLFNGGSTDISSLKDDSYAVYEFESDGTDVSDIYFTAGSSEFVGNGRKYVLSSVCAAKYIDSADGLTSVRIPLSDFESSDAVVRVYDDTAGTLDFSEAAPDFSKFSTMGIIKSGDNETDISKLLIVKYNIEQKFEIKDATDKDVSIAWNKPETLVNSYVIYRDGEEIGTAGGNEVTFTDTPEGGFVADREYVYTVAANAECGAVFESEPLSVTIPRLDMPRNSSAVTVYSDGAKPTIELSWESPKFGDSIRSGYEIYRDGERIATADKDSRVYSDTNISYGSEYEYTMRSVGYDGEEIIYSLFTPKMSAYAVCLKSPENVSVSVSGTNIYISWDSVDYASEYEVYVDGVLKEKTSYTNLTMAADRLNTYFDIAVAAVNASGAKSFESVYTGVFVADPLLDGDSVVIYDDSFSKQYTAENNAVCTERDTDRYASGAASAKLDFTDVVKSQGAVNISYTFDAQKMRSDGKRLTLQLFADNPDMLGDMYIGLGMSAKVNNKDTTVWADVNLSDYAQSTDRWQYVSVPLADFPETGVYVADAKENRLQMDYSKISSMRFMCNNKYNKPAVIHIDELKIEGYRDWRMADIIRDTDGNVIDKNNVGAISGIRLLFDMAMNPDSLSSTTVTIENADGKKLSAYGKYNADEHAYTVYFAEPLKAQSSYTLTICAESAVSGKSQTVSVPLKTGVFDEYTVEDNSIVIGYDITGSVSGSNAVVTFKPKAETACMTNSANMIITYDSSYLKVKSTGDLFKNIDGDVTVTAESGKLNIGLKSDTPFNLSSCTFAVPFEILKNGSSNISIKGESELINSPKAVFDSSSVLSLAAEDNSGDKKGSGGGSSSGGSSSALRPADSNTAREPEKKTFSDIGEYGWAVESIEFLASKNIISGFDDGTFRPGNYITREEFTKLLVAVCAIEDDTAEMKFNDVVPGSWYEKYVYSAAKYGVINGIGNDEFGIGKLITREDMCVMLDRAMAKLGVMPDYIYDEIPFDDYSEVSDYAKDSVRKMFRYGYVNGVGNNKFDGKGTVNRAMAAKVLYAAYAAVNN